MPKPQPAKPAKPQPASKNLPPSTTKATAVVHKGHDPSQHQGMANPPVYHTSTVMRESLADYRAGRGTYDYGRIGTPTSTAVEEAVADLYGYDQCIATPSGLSAVAVAISSLAETGGSVLLPDSMYGSGRRFAEHILPSMGVVPRFYDPLIDGEGMTRLIAEAETDTANTPPVRLMYLESPGSLSFEMQDLQALVAVAKKTGLPTLFDNTWGTAFHCDPRTAGIDVVIEAGTKYISGHSDLNIGFVVADDPLAQRIRQYARYTGLCAGADTYYLALRGMRTMAVRLKQSEATGLVLAKWLEAQPEVVAMLHPALPSHPQHELWQRDFTGGCGLFGFVIDGGVQQKAVDAWVDGLRLFGIGASWGGHESLISQADPKRSVRPAVAGGAGEGKGKNKGGYLMRIYAGLEDSRDLVADLEAGLKKMRGK